MKPHEETWTAEYGPADPDDRGDIDMWTVDFPDGYCVYVHQDEARARLITAAPDMARVLLAVEWKQVTLAGPRWCVACERTEPTGHLPNCALDAALRKAGVR